MEIFTPNECSFNIKHSTTIVVVENAFGRLNGRFRSISKRLALNVENSCNVIAASCVLHNYCGYLHEFFADQWLNGVNVHVGVCPADPDQRQNINATAIRDGIMSFFCKYSVKNVTKNFQLFCARYNASIRSN